MVMPTGTLFTPKSFTSYEYQSYGVDFTQADSTIIPSSTTVGNCNDPGVFKVAIIDSGYHYYHPDSPCTTDASGNPNCIGYSFISSDPWDAPVENWHGTHVTGIIGSLSGNSPYSNVGIMPTRNGICYLIYRVFPESGAGAPWSNVLAAVDSAVFNKVNVINMSLGGGSVTGAQDFFTAAYAAGTLVVAAAGNDAGNVYSYPASYDNVISVAAIDSDK
jgi:serine protease